MVHLLQKIQIWMTPRYNELMTFQTALICILLPIAYPEIRTTYNLLLDNSSSGPLAPVAIIWSIIGIIGLGLSVWHIFVWRRKTSFENFFMSAFVMGANGLAGIAAGMEIFPTRWSIMVLFPLWNIVFGTISIYQMALIPNIITDENVSLSETTVTTVCLVALFSITYYRLGFTWATTLSICLCFATATSFSVPWTMNMLRSYRVLKD